MTHEFQISTVADGYFQFTFVNGTGERVLSSPEFETRELVEEAVQAVRLGSLMSQQIAKGKTPEGSWFFLIKDSGGEVIAKSGLYSNEMSFDNALHNVRENACVAAMTFTGG